MAADSKLWLKAYESYNKWAPNSKHNLKEPKAKRARRLSKEPMLIRQEYVQVIEQIAALTKRKSELRREMRKFGVEPIRLQYFDRPILLYALQLEDDCWYIGMSRNVDRRYKAHLKGKTLWTAAHKPVAVAEVRETGLSDDAAVARLEDDMTLEYALKYGSDKVRGGGYCQAKPQWPDVVTLNEVARS